MHRETVHVDGLVLTSPQMLCWRRDGQCWRVAKMMMTKGAMKEALQRTGQAGFLAYTEEWVLLPARMPL